MGSTRRENQSPEKNHPCLWMQAGVVHRKFCDIDYDCSPCRFDRIMRQAAIQNKKLKEEGKTPKGKKAEIVFWKDRLKELPTNQRPCLHHMKGRIDFRACTHEYRCGNCEFDQYFQDQYTVHAFVRPVDFLDVEGFKIPQGYYLHQGHCWAKLEEGSEVRLGIDDFALRLLGPLDQIKAPLVGKEIQQNRSDILMNRGKFEAKVLSPISGVVTAVNSKLREQGNVANEDPYSEGWILRIHSSNLRQDLKNLMIGDETETFYSQEIHRLYEVIEDTVGPLTADGGQLNNDIFGNLPQLGWERLIKLFLHT
ncbi:MAG: glycine cleavage system protein H [Desulfobacteraceae bacterium]|nr:glycine cleavage system protein H [Desulfobacteraceae bacterium]MDH3721558.1 glycine cleavage system protein H [Desulfobacteraceae bacterium]MDH3837632.1 glycine cleavage system protein H [Desulfobacteraceae bacterium]MDH3874861.1 glycine cleavage system protein H [Desulfobacteraceae bacterium]